MRECPITVLPSAIIGDWERCAPAWIDLGSGGMTLYSAFICWLILNELFVLTILGGQSHE
jgi:hypothetical protein